MSKVQFVHDAKSSTVEVHGGQSLLDAAVANDLPVSYSCKRGDCGQCLAKLLSGDVGPLDASRPLDREDCIYLCNAVPRGDLCIELPYVPELDGIRVVRSACKIHELIRCSADVLQVSLRLPPSTSFKCRPGQYIRLTKKNSVTRYFSCGTTGML